MIRPVFKLSRIALFFPHTFPRCTTMVKNDEVDDIPLSLNRGQVAEPLYSIFTSSEKWVIVTLASIAGVFRCANGCSLIAMFHWTPSQPVIGVHISSCNSNDHDCVSREYRTHQSHGDSLFGVSRRLSVNPVAFCLFFLRTRLYYLKHPWCGGLSQIALAGDR